MQTLQEVILVDENDVPTGTMEKLEAHQKGELHRAFSVFIFTSKGEVLLQKRALHKYHSGGLWTNACCSHPIAGESMENTVQKRLTEEMGISCKLRKLFQYTYKAQLDNGLTEHELDHVFIGYTDEQPQINPDEVSEWKYVEANSLLEHILQSPEQYTAWFRLIFPEVMKHINNG